MPALVCPDCGTCSISVSLRWDAIERERLRIASCRSCGKKYDAEVLPTYSERYWALRRMAEREPCPLCQSRQRVVRSMCDRIARECFFLFACGSCGDVRLAP